MNKIRLFVIIVRVIIITKRIVRVRNATMNAISNGNMKKFKFRIYFSLCFTVLQTFFTMVNIVDLVSWSKENNGLKLVSFLQQLGAIPKEWKCPNGHTCHMVSMEKTKFFWICSGNKITKKSEAAVLRL